MSDIFLENSKDLQTFLFLGLNGNFLNLSRFNNRSISKIYALHHKKI